MSDFAPIGSVLLGKYRVDDVIGEGGMGIVLLAYHLQLRERVALKFPKRESLRQPGAAGRFLSEARAAIRIKSEHVARVVDVGTLDDETPFIVMEYLEGETLSQYAAREAPLDVQRIVEFVTQISEAIAEAHALGIVHRDLKPANIFLSRRADGILAAKVLDFGISQVTDCSWEDMISADELETALGSPAYASPEQLQSPHRVDARTDIWSLGVLMYELATGRLPFSADTTVALCGKVIFDPFEPLGTMRPDLPVELCTTIHRCLEKDPQVRLSSVGRLATELLAFASPRARASIERIVRTEDPTTDEGSTLAPIAGRADTTFSRGLSTAVRMLPRNRQQWLAWAAFGALILGSAGAARDTLLSTPMQPHRLQPNRPPAGSGISDAHPGGFSLPIATYLPSGGSTARPESDALPASSSSFTSVVVPSKLVVKRKSARRSAGDMTTGGRPSPVPALSNEGDGYLDDPAYSSRQ